MRGLVVLLALGLLAASLSADAQQPTGVPRIGYLGTSSPSLEPHLVEAFRQKLRDLGYVEGGDGAPARIFAIEA